MRVRRSPPPAMPRRFVPVEAWTPSGVSEEWRATWDAVQAASDPEVLNATLQRAAAALPRVAAPRGVALWLLAAGALLLCAQTVVRMRLARNFLRRYGHATALRGAHQKHL